MPRSPGRGDGRRKGSGQPQMTLERRLKKRYPVQIDATVITPTASVEVVTVDISTDGLRITSPESILPERDVAISLATGEETLMSGTILWALEISERETPLYDVGIGIDSLISREREAIGFAEKEALVAEILSRIQRTEIA
jgi:hypothetical protein